MKTVWRVLRAVLRGLLWAFADEVPGVKRPKPRAGKKKGGRKASPTKEHAPAGPPADELLWWVTPEVDPQPAAPSPRTSDSSAAPKVRVATPAAGFRTDATPPTRIPTIKVATEDGTFIAAASFSGEHVLGIRRAEKVREPGESRRHRRRRAAPEAVLSAEIGELLHCALVGTAACTDEVCLPAPQEPAPEPEALPFGFTWGEPIEVEPETDEERSELDAEVEQAVGAETDLDPLPESHDELENEEPELAASADATPTTDEAPAPARRVALSKAERRAQRKARKQRASRQARAAAAIARADASCTSSLAAPASERLRLVTSLATRLSLQAQPSTDQKGKVA